MPAPKRTKRAPTRPPSTKSALMLVVVKRPGEGPKVETIDRRRVLHALQQLVGGFIEIAMRGEGYFGDSDLIWYCNEEGHLLELPLNVCRPSDGNPIAGTIVAVKIKAGDDVSMTGEEAAQVQTLTATLRVCGEDT